MPERTPHTPVKSPHRLRTRIIAGSAVASAAIATPLALELTPDIFPDNGGQDNPGQITYPTRYMARVEPGVKKVTIPEELIRPAATHSEPQPETRANKESKHKARSRDTIKVETELKAELVPGSKTTIKTPGIVIPKTETKPPYGEAPMELTEAKVPAEISQIMRERTAYIGGCSAFLFPDAQGGQVGGITAEHCGLESQSGRWGGTPQKRTIDMGRAFTASVGDQIDQLTKAGNITQVLLNAEGDTTHDQAYFTLDGHSMDEVMANNPQMSAQEIASLPKGSVIYNSGWPVDQKANNGPLKRQEFAMTVLGTATSTTTKGQTLKLLYALVPATDDGAECSWGNSGSAAFIRSASGQIKTIGAAAAFNDWGYLYNADPDKAQTSINWVKGKFNVKFDQNKFVGVCGFAYEPPTAEEGAVLADVIPYEQTSPGETQSPAEQQITKDFFSPNTPRTIIDGFVSVSGGKDEYTVDRPAIYYDKESQITYLAYYSGEGNRHLYLLPIGGKGFDGLDRLKVYSRDGETKPSIQYHTGAIVEKEGNASYFEDEHGYVFAGGVRDGVPEGQPLDNVTLDEGTFSLESVTKREDIQQAFAEFIDSNFDRIAVDGLMPLDEGNDRLSRWVNKGFIFYNPGSGSVVVIYADPDYPTGIGHQYFESLDDIRVYKQPGDETVSTETVKGALDYHDDPSGATHGGYSLKDSQELYGQLLDPAPTNTGQTYKFRYENGVFTPYPVEYNNPTDTKKLELAGVS